MGKKVILHSLTPLVGRQTEKFNFDKSGTILGYAKIKGCCGYFIKMVDVLSNSFFLFNVNKNMC